MNKKAAIYEEYGLILRGLKQEARVLDGVHDITPPWALYGLMEVLGAEDGPPEIAHHDRVDGITTHVYLDRHWTAVLEPGEWFVWY